MTVGDRGGRPQVLEDDHQWWKLRSRSGQAGYVPRNILDEIRAEEAGAPHEVMVMGVSGSAVPPQAGPSGGGGAQGRRGRCMGLRERPPLRLESSLQGLQGLAPGQWGPGQVLGGKGAGLLLEGDE